MTPSVSVIIPTYNSARTLPACLTSLKQQSLNAEIIVVDDGSTDASAGLAASYPGVKVMRQPHKGVGIARNTGAHASRGNILVFLDADMVFERECVESLIKPIQGSIVGTFTKDEYVLNWDNWWARCWNFEYLNVISKRRIPENTPDTSPVYRAITKKAFDSVGGYTPGGYDDDWSLASKLHQPATLARHAIVYHQNPGTFLDVFRQAQWVSSRSYKLGEWGKIIAFIRANPAFSIIVGMMKAFRSQEPLYPLFKLVYNVGVMWGLMKYWSRS